jgi:hypothetical protein
MVDLHAALKPLTLADQRRVVEFARRMLSCCLLLSCTTTVLELEIGAGGLAERKDMGLCDP